MAFEGIPSPTLYETTPEEYTDTPVHSVVISKLQLIVVGNQMNFGMLVPFPLPLLGNTSFQIYSHCILNFNTVVIKKSKCNRF